MRLLRDLRDLFGGVFGGMCDHFGADVSVFELATRPAAAEFPVEMKRLMIAFAKLDASDAPGPARYESFAKYMNEHNLVEFMCSDKFLDYALKHNMYRQFIEVCSNGHIDVARWIHALGGIDIRADRDGAFLAACLNGHIEVAQWLVDLGADPHEGNDIAFIYACTNGHLDVAKWIGVDIHIQYNPSFRRACYGGHLNVARWIYSLGGVDIHMYDDVAFREACTRGHIDVARWVYSLGGVNIHAINDYAFRFVCENGHIDVAQWIYSLGGVDIHTYEDVAFRGACADGHIDVARWLISLGVDINICQDADFKHKLRPAKSIRTSSATSESTE